jgi:arylformamidase
MSLYRGMDRAALDAAYNNGAAVPDSAAIIERWERESAQRRARTRPDHLDLCYGSAERERIDFFAARASGAPTLLFIHGGYWQTRSKEIFAFLAEGPQSLGASFATLGYSLAPEARLSEIVAQCRRGVRWLQTRLGALGGDPERLYVSGWSAGGHLAAMMMEETAVKGGLVISGIFDLEPIRLSYLNEKLRLDAAEARANSPLLRLPARAAPLMVAVGGDELPELRRQSETYCAHWRRAGLPGDFVPLPGRHHYTALEELARPEGLLTRALARLMGG